MNQLFQFREETYIFSLFLVSIHIYLLLPHFSIYLQYLLLRFIIFQIPSKLNRSKKPNNNNATTEGRSICKGRVWSIARSAGTGTDICTRRRNFKQPVPVPFPHQAFSGLIRLGSVLSKKIKFYLSQSFFRTRRS